MFQSILEAEKSKAAVARHQVLLATMTPCKRHSLHKSTDWASGSGDLRTPASHMMPLVNNFWVCQQRWFTFPVTFQGAAVPLPREQSFRVGICRHTRPQLNTTARRTKGWNINAQSPRSQTWFSSLQSEDRMRQGRCKRTLLIYASRHH